MGGAVGREGLGGEKGGGKYDQAGKKLINKTINKSRITISEIIF